MNQPEHESNKFSDFFKEQMKDPEFAAAYKKTDAEENVKLQAAFQREWKLRELEKAVVESARAWREQRLGALDAPCSELAKLYMGIPIDAALLRAITALIAFESEHES